MASVPVRVVVLPHGEGLPLPAYETLGSAGADVRAAIQEAVVLAPGERRLFPTGLKLALPMGWELQVRPRSGLAMRHGVTLPNAPGTVDADYRGELCVPLINHGDLPITISRGDRIAQILVMPVWQIDWVVCEALNATDRGDQGFGSTGR